MKALSASVPLQVSFLGERHASRPPGASGGGPGQPGRLERRRGRATERLRAKASLVLAPGDVLTVATPGGGGYGRR